MPEVRGFRVARCVRGVRGVRFPSREVCARCPSARFPSREVSEVPPSRGFIILLSGLGSLGPTPSPCVPHREGRVLVRHFPRLGGDLLHQRCYLHATRLVHFASAKTSVSSSRGWVTKSSTCMLYTVHCLGPALSDVPGTHAARTASMYAGAALTTHAEGELHISLLDLHSRFFCGHNSSELRQCFGLC